MKISSIVLLSALVLLASSEVFSQQVEQSGKSNPVSKVEADQLGETKNVHRVGNLYLTGQFTPEDLEKLKVAGIERVITLRNRGEIDWDEAKAVRDAGIEFIEVPVQVNQGLDDGLFDNIRKLLKDDKSTLLHCGSANRVGGVWLPYRVLDQGVELSEAVEEAGEIGLSIPLLKEKALDYIKRKSTSNGTGTDSAMQDSSESAQPGINAGFVDPNLNVDDFVKRFEIESREIYSARNAIVDACRIQAGDVVADVGAGTGLFSRIFANKVEPTGWVCAIDVSPRLIEHIVQSAASDGQNNITGIICSQSSIGLPPEILDKVFVCDTYHHFEHPASTLASIHSALKSDGELIVIDFERVQGKSRDWVMGHVRAGKETFRAEILDAGFVLVREEKISGLSENYFLVFRKE